jgi:ribosome biogenesis GTPase
MLNRWGWNAHFARAFAACGGRGVPGRVAAVDRGRCLVWTEAGDAYASGSDAAIGDWVALENGRVRAVLERRTSFGRKRAGRRMEEQVLAANVDVLFVVTGLDGDYRAARLDRYRVAALAGGIRPVVVLNKADLCDEARCIAEEVRSRGCEVAVTSAATGAGVAGLAAFAGPGETVAMVGSSGVGKSSLVNALLGGSVQAVVPVREHDHRGQHTTVRRELFEMPGGWVLMDTPGLRELEPWGAGHAVDAAFADISALAAECRFRDCRHAGEPGCAVIGAVAAETLESFHKLGAELAFQERKTDPRLAMEEKRRWKRIAKEIRRIAKE